MTVFCPNLVQKPPFESQFCGLLASKQVIFLNGLGTGQTLTNIFCTSRPGDMSPLILHASRAELPRQQLSEMPKRPIFWPSFSSLLVTKSLPDLFLMLSIPVVVVIVVNVVMEVVVASCDGGCGVEGVPTTTTTTATTTTPTSTTKLNYQLFDIFACPWRDLCRHRLRETDPAWPTF